MQHFTFCYCKLFVLLWPGEERQSRLVLSASFLFAVWPLALSALAVNIKLIIGPVSRVCQVRRKTHSSERHMIYGWAHTRSFVWAGVL